jgi:hypothetical protein
MQRFISAVAFVLAFTAIAVAGYALRSHHQLDSRVLEMQKQLAAQGADALARDTRAARSAGIRFQILETDWTDTDGAPLQARMALGPGTVAHSILILVQLRNKSDQEQVIGGFGLWPSNIELLHGGKKMQFLGPYKMLSASMAPPPIQLLPGEITSAMIELSSREYAELNQPGLITAKCTYVSQPGLPSQPQVTWTGTLTSVKAQWRIK